MYGGEGYQPQMNSGYPSYPQYPQQGGFSQQPSHPQQGGYPQRGSCPGHKGGYLQQGGYPGQHYGYPNYHSQDGGYSSQHCCCPQQKRYPGQQGNYPNYRHQGGDYSSQQCCCFKQAGYPGQHGSYYPQQEGHPGQHSCYPNCPHQSGDYSSQQCGCPKQAGYPGQQGTYPQSGSYPGQQGSYPQSGSYPGQQGGYPNYTTQSSDCTGQQESGYPGQHSDGQREYSHSQSGDLYPSPHQESGDQGDVGHSATPEMQPNGHRVKRGNPTIRPYTAFNANEDAEALRKAMKGFGCDKSKIISILCARSNDQRQEIAKKFKTLYGKDLLKELKSELVGDFEDLILGLMEPPAKYDAYQLHKAMARVGTRESVLIEIMCSRTNAEIAELRQAYKEMYEKELESYLTGETSGHFKRLLVSMCVGGRDESGSTDPVKAEEDARALYGAGHEQLGTDESCFNAVLASQNYAQLCLVFDKYRMVSGGKSIEESIKSEFSGDICEGLLAIVACVQNTPAYFAKLLHESMKGVGTHDTDLIRIIVTRSEVDLADIREEFERKYGKSLSTAIKKDCSGAYEDGLIALVNGN